MKRAYVSLPRWHFRYLRGLLVEQQGLSVKQLLDLQRIAESLDALLGDYQREYDEISAEARSEYAGQIEAARRKIRDEKEQGVAIKEIEAGINAKANERIGELDERAKGDEVITWMLPWSDYTYVRDNWDRGRTWDGSDATRKLILSLNGALTGPRVTEDRAGEEEDIPVPKVPGANGRRRR